MAVLRIEKGKTVCGCIYGKNKGIDALFYCQLHSAAPDLLEACKAAALLIGEFYSNKDDLWGIYSQLIKALQSAGMPS